MEALKELIRLYGLTDNQLTRAWLRDTFESAKMDVFIICSDAEVQEVRAMRIGERVKNNS